MLNPDHIRRRFEHAAATFDDVDFVHAETRAGLLSRLQPLVTKAKTVIDLGSATCSAGAHLSKRFAGAHIISIDLAHNMLKAGRAKRSWFSKSSFAQADAAALPFADESIDVVFANLLLPWIDEPTAVFSEIARVLRREGVFAFATLGPDSLQELVQAWRHVDDYPHVNRFLDMHNIGDGLMKAGFRDPVLDVDRLSVKYQNSKRLFADLKSAGARNTYRNRSPGLGGKQRIATMTGALGETDLTLNLELVYGHCWGAGPGKDPRDWRVDATQIPRRRSGTHNKY